MTSNLQQMFNNALSSATGLKIGKKVVEGVKEVSDQPLKTEAKQKIEEAGNASQAAKTAFAHKDIDWGDIGEGKGGMGGRDPKVIQAALALKRNNPNFGFYTNFEPLSYEEDPYGYRDYFNKGDAGLGSLNRYEERVATLNAQKLYLEGRKNMLKGGKLNG